MGWDRDWDEDRPLNKDIGWGWAYREKKTTILAYHTCPWEWRVS